MKTQVLSVEQMQHLKELGVDTSKASCAYYAFYESEPNYYELRIRDSALEIDPQTIPFIPTLTLQDMLEMMPYEIEDYFRSNGKDFKSFARIKIIPYGDGKWQIIYRECIMYLYIFESSETDLLTCAYETLCWLTKNGYLKGGKNENK